MITQRCLCGMKIVSTFQHYTNTCDDFGTTQNFISGYENTKSPKAQSCQHYTIVVNIQGQHRTVSLGMRVLDSKRPKAENLVTQASMMPTNFIQISGLHRTVYLFVCCFSSILPRGETLQDSRVSCFMQNWINQSININISVSQSSYWLIRQMK